MTATPKDMPGRPPFDRARWEQALMDSDIHWPARLAGFTLAHHAPTGRLRAGSVQHSARLAERTRLSPDRVRHALRELELAGLISRPPAEGWEPRSRPRPITLTLPHTAPAAPPSTGGPA